MDNPIYSATVDLSQGSIIEKNSINIFPDDLVTQMSFVVNFTIEKSTGVALDLTSATGQAYVKTEDSGQSPISIGSFAITSAPAGTCSFTIDDTEIPDSLAAFPQSPRQEQGVIYFDITDGANVSIQLRRNVTFVDSTHEGTGGANPSAAEMDYTPAVAGDWAIYTTVPDDVAEALDNLAEYGTDVTAAHIADTANPHATDLGNLGTGTLAELNATITDLIATYGAVRDIGVGTLAQRPAFGTASRFFWTTDEQVLYRDTGAAWEAIIPGAHATTHEEGGSDEVDPANLDLHKIGTPTYTSIQDMNVTFHSAGKITGGAVTDAGGGNVDVAAGTGYIRATGTEVGDLLSFDWIASTGNAIPSDTTRFIGIEYNAGSPQVVIKTSDTWDFFTDFPLAVVVNEGGTIYIGDEGQNVGDHANNMIQRAGAIQAIARDAEAGGLILGETGTRNLTTSAGVLWRRINKFSISAIDTSAAGTFDRYYRDGGGGFTKESAQTQWNNTQYDDGTGTLATFTSNRYGAQYFYLHTDGSFTSMYGQAQYTSQAAAEGDSPPASVPSRIEETGILIGRIIFQESGASTLAVESAFDTTFAAAQTSDHGDLSGLGDDDHTQYTLADGTRAFTGDQSMGTNDLTNVGNIEIQMAEVVETGTSFTLTLGTHEGVFKMVTATNASTITVTVPTNAAQAFPTGTVINVLQGGAGQVQFSSAGVTVLLPSDRVANLRGQESACSLWKTATNTWQLIGDLETA